MKFLAIGDVVGDSGLSILDKKLGVLIRRYGADFVIVNGENASGTGITSTQAEAVFHAGADVVTLGNHAFGNRDIVPRLTGEAPILRPANYAPHAPGRGFFIVEKHEKRVLVINLIGRFQMPFSAADNPFLLVEAILAEWAGAFDFAIVEFHAEATSEKLAMGFFLDGKVGMVYGTHTHVPTADARIHQGGTGYMTDIGMTGPYESVLGIRPEQSIAMFRGELTSRFQAADGPPILSGVFFELSDETGRCLAIEPFSLIGGKG